MTNPIEHLFDKIYNLVPAHPNYIPAKNQLFKIKIITNKVNANVMRIPLQSEYVKAKMLEELKKQHPEIKIKQVFVELHTDSSSLPPKIWFEITVYGYVDPLQLITIALIILGILGAITLITWYIAQIEYYIAYQKSQEHGGQPPPPPSGLPGGGLPGIGGAITGGISAIVIIIILLLLLKVIK